ncbi:MAG: VOC family protein [Chlorobi bacterium]|nr:VOC family protein [Chlorobiota bacterium]
MKSELNSAEGHQTVMPYLIVEGAEKFINFMKQVFDAEERFQVLRSESENEIMHAEVVIGDSTIMLADATSEYRPSPTTLYIYDEDTDKRYEQALVAGASSIYEPHDEEYGVRAAGVKDQFDNRWWLATLIEEHKTT